MELKNVSYLASGSNGFRIGLQLLQTLRIHACAKLSSQDVVTEK
jgi:hypothetical protein